MSWWRGPGGSDGDTRSQRERMVADQIATRGIRDPRVLEAMRAVPRQEFVPPEIAPHAYDDAALPIAEGQTISQPYVVAAMAEAARIEPDDVVLEVGTGSGYGAAVLGELAAEVYSIERYASLAEEAAARLRALGYDNVHVKQGDGTLGWQEHAPFDAIIVTAGAPEPPGPLQDQLAVGGRLVVPVGRTTRVQELVRITRTGPDSYERDDLGDVRFVPLVGAEGWDEGAE